MIPTPGPLRDYRADFLAPPAASRLLQALLTEARWVQESLTLFGRPRPVPRLVAWYGDPGINYRYAGADHVCEGWSAPLTVLRRRLASEFGFASNLVLLNRYRDGNDAMGWHRDDEPGLDPCVASVSLGAPRRLLVRPDAAARSQALTLEHGSLLLLDGTQRHALPRTRRPVAERINLTFRRLAPAA
jgi:alkylated DNA repair dioxygenase AlkB